MTMNMSHCRFENTDSALRECLDAVQAMIDGEAPALSDSELRALKRLSLHCADFVKTLADAAPTNVLNMDDDALSDFESAAHAVCDHIQAEAQPES